ncbi:exo-1, 3-beta-D-glucanase [Colletotrichum camelliae]|nr:exo-1, 3-beta-D-glucanase [Colletotrichum camelliae]
MPTTSTTFPSYQERLDAGAIGLTPDAARIFWKLQGPLSTCVFVVEDHRNMGSAREPYARQDSWHPVSQASVTEPKIGSITVTVDALRQWQENWLELHERHADPDDDDCVFGKLDPELYAQSDEEEEEDDEDNEEDRLELLRCCGTDRPTKGKSLIVKPSDVSKGYVTVHDYISAVHPWLMGMREEIIQADNVWGDRTAKDYERLVVEYNIPRTLMIMDEDRFLMANGSKKRPSAVSTTSSGIDWAAVAREPPNYKGMYIPNLDTMPKHLLPKDLQFLVATRPCKSMQQLLALARPLGPRGNNKYPLFNERDSVIMFQFRAIYQPAQPYAAWVVTYDDPAWSIVQSEIGITQIKRSNENVTEPFPLTWADKISGEELIAMMSKASPRQWHPISLNETVDDLPFISLPGDMASDSLSFGSEASDNWWKEDDLEEEYQGELDDSKDDDDEQVSSVRHVQNITHFNIPKRAFVPAVRDTSKTASTPLLKNATSSDIGRARRIVQEAMAQSATLNKARLARPLRNKYSLKPGTVLGAGSGIRRRRQTVTAGEGDLVVPPLLNITEVIASAAALLSEADAAGISSNLTRNSTLHQRARRATSGTYWMEHLGRKGTVPWGGDDPTYKVFRNVLDFSAVGDGVTDDTKAIKKATDDGRRCGEKCNGSTTKNAIVYFPPGTYLISTPIPMPFGTQVIGDADNWPTLLASHNFIGLGVLSSDEYTGVRNPDGSDEQWYINTANFYRHIRNIRIDITQTQSTQDVACIHWQVAQATSIQNAKLIAASGSKNQYGIFAENGSGGVISDITFRGGAFGLYGGEQQFTAQRMTFDGCTTGVQIICDWGWVWKSITMTNVDVGFRLLGEAGGSGNVGSAAIYDSSFQNVGTAVLIAPPDSAPGSGSTSVIIENVSFQGVAKAVADTSGSTLLVPAGKVSHWALGTVYSSKDRQFSMEQDFRTFNRQSSLLDSKGNYFERAKPQYEGSSVGDFVHIKDLGVLGDGVTDDTAAFQSALYSSLGKILFIDAGSYILTNTTTIPRGAKIIGETWSQLVAAGSFFEDAKAPRPLIQVGKPGDVSDVEMQDLIITTRGPTAGVILFQWNLRAATAGSAALWDVHVRIGGATGTQLTPTECPALTSGIAQGCNAGSLLMHITSTASGYFENMWLWVADHMIDDPDLEDAANPMVQTSIYVARGLLVESVQPVWLYGTASEHAVFYQYNFHNARNIFAGLLQTESPYYQPTPQPPVPFQDVVDVFKGDPDYSHASRNEFNGCDESWAVMMRGCANVSVAGAGVYTWFSTYTQECIDQHACQKVLVLLDDNYANVRFQNLVTIGAKYMAVMDGVGISALDNLNVEGHPRWSLVSILDVTNGGRTFQEVGWIDHKIWAMETPGFTCALPCVVKLPPWTGATSTVNFPIGTVSDGAWTTAITRPPITISKWMFQEVTLSAGGVAARATAGAGSEIQARQAGAPVAEFWPVPATTPFRPPVTYIGPDGYDPFVDQCYFADFSCPNPWSGYGEAEDGPEDPEDPYDEYGPEGKVTCPPATSTSATSKSAVPTQPTQAVPVPVPAPSPLEHGNPINNKNKCYNAGRGADHTRIDNAIKSFCNQLGDEGSVIRDKFHLAKTVEFPRRSGELGLEVVMTFTPKKGCEWTTDFDQCARYLKVPVDSCDCSGVDSKHGGTVTNNCYYWRLDPNNKW